MKKLLLATVAVTGMAVAAPQADAAILIATISGNDCVGVFGGTGGTECITSGTFNGTPLNQTPLIAKFDFTGNTITATRTGVFFPSITGSEFQLSGAASGTITYTYTPGVGDPLIQYVAVKGGDEFNLFAVGGAGTDTVFAPLNNGVPREVSHISFYDTSVPTPPNPVPEPASLLLFGAGLLGLGVARRKASQNPA
jgi:hypothetical protein